MTGAIAPVPPPRRHYLRWTIIGLIVIALAFLAWREFGPSSGGSSGAAGGRRGAQAQQALSVSVAAAAKADIPIIQNALGTVTPLSTVAVHTRIAGQLTQVGFTEGQVVKAGDFLAQIDPRPYQAALAQALGQLQHDQAVLKMAQADLARYKKLQAENSIARQQADNQEFVVEQDMGTVQSDQGQVAAAQLNLEYCRITAPSAGVAGLLQVTTGNYVQPSDANGIVVITQTAPISVLFAIPEDNLPQVLKQLRAGSGLPVTAFDRSGATQLAQGKLLSTDNQIDTTTGTVKLRAQFDNAEGGLFPNQFVNVKLLVDTVKDAISVPVAAIQRGSPGTFVYVAQPDSSVKLTVVTLGPATATLQSVTKGLNEGDQVVTDGADKLKDGSKIAIRPATGSPEAAAAADADSKPADQSKGGASKSRGASEKAAPAPAAATK